MSFGWANLTDLASNLAEKGTSFLAELDERIEGDEIEESREHGSGSEDEEDLPLWSRKSDNKSADAGEGRSSPTAKVTPAAIADESASPNKLKDIQALQDELQQVKGMREELKKDVTGQMQQISNEMQGAIATLGSNKNAEPSALPPGGVNTADATLLARAQLAEERLSSAEAAINKLRASMQTNKEEIAAARAAEAQFAKHKTKMQVLAQEKEEAEMALRNLTKMQSLEREELNQQLQDLQSKAAAERQYGQSKAEESKQVHAQLAAVMQQMKDITAEHAEALSSAKRATVAVEQEGDYGDLCARLEAQDTHCALQEEVLAETRTQLDSYIKTTAEAERHRDEAAAELEQISAQLSTAQEERHSLHQRLEQVSSSEQALHSQLEASAAVTAENEQLRNQLEASAAVTAENEQLRTQLEASAAVTAENEQLRSQLEASAAVTAENEQLRSQLEASAAVTAENEQTINKLAGEVETVEQREQGMMLTFQELQQENKELHKIAASLEARLQETEEIVTKAKETAAQESLQNAQADETAAQAFEELKQRVEDLQAQNVEWETAAEAATAARKQEVSHAQTAVQEANQRVSEAIEQARIASEASQLQQKLELDAKDKEMADLEKRLHDYFAEAASQGDASQSFQEELEAKEAQLAAAHAEVKRERTRAENAENQASKTAAQHALEMSTQAAKITELQDEHFVQLEAQAAAVAAAHAEAAKATKALEKSKDNLKNALSKTVELNQELLETKAQAEAAAAAAKQTLQDREQEHEEGLEASKLELTQLKAAQQDLQQTLQENKQEKEKLQQQHQEAEQLAQTLQLALDEAKEGMHRGQGDLEAQLADKNSQLEEALASFKQTLQDREQEHEEGLEASKLELTQLKAAQQDLQQTLQENKQEKEKLQQQHQEAEQLAQTLQLALDEAKEGMHRGQGDLEAQLADKNSQLEEALASLQAAEAAAAADRADKENMLSAQQTALQVAMSQVEERYEMLSSRLEQHRTRADRAEETLARAREEHECEVSTHVSRISSLEEAHADTHALHSEVEQKHTLLLSESASLEKKYLDLQQSQQTLEKQWADRVEELEIAAQDRTVDNASLREQVRACEATLEQLHARHSADQQEISALTSKEAAVIGAGQSALQEVQAQLKLQSEAAADAQVRAETAIASKNSLTTKLASLEKELTQTQTAAAQAQAATAQANEYILRCEAAETQLAKLEAKKGRDLEALKAQNGMMAALKSELAEAREAQGDAEDALVVAQKELAGAISPAVITDLQRALREEQENSRRTRELHDALQRQVAQSAAAHGGQANSNEVAEAHLRAELTQAREQLAGLLAQSLVAANKETETERVLASLRAELAAEQGASESTAAQNRQYIQKLEAERTRLENELHESSTGVGSVGASLHVPGSRQRPNTSSSPFHGSSAADLEAGVALLAENDDDDGHRKQGDPIPAVINTIWRAAAKYPALLSYIGETPPRLGPLGRGLAGYIIVLHILLLLGVV